MEMAYGDEATRRLHREGSSYSIHSNDRWRITLRIEDNRALDVMIEDEH